MAKVFHEPIMNDPVFRRLAGEGWHPDGLNFTLLGALAVEEILYKQINEELKQYGSASRETLDLYGSQKHHVEDLRQELSIGDPPPLPPEEQCLYN